jgi:hypothetical protein
MLFYELARHLNVHVDVVPFDTACYATLTCTVVRLVETCAPKTNVVLYYLPSPPNVSVPHQGFHPSTNTVTRYDAFVFQCELGTSASRIVPVRTKMRSVLHNIQWLINDINNGLIYRVSS